jgi:serine protease Do
MVFMNCPKCGQNLHLEPVEKAQGIRCPACKHKFTIWPHGQSQAGADTRTYVYQDVEATSQPEPVTDALLVETIPVSSNPFPTKGLLAILAALGIALTAAVVYKTVILPGRTVNPPKMARSNADTTTPKPRTPKPDQPEERQPAPGPKPAKNPVPRAVVTPPPPPETFTNALNVIRIPPEMPTRVSPSVAMIAMEGPNGRAIGIASGFIVAKGIVATNMHVLRNGARGYARIAGDETKHDIRGVVALNPECDLVLLAVDGLQANPLTIADSNAVSVGDGVYVAGNPRGLSVAFSPGIVRSVRKVGNIPLLRITAPICPGASGGPVVNSKGEVIAVALAAFNGNQNLNFAIPSRYLSAMIKIIKPLTPLPIAHQEIFILDKLGVPSAEGVQGREFLWKYSHGQTGAYSFSLQNKLNQHVKNVVCMVVFYDKSDQPIETDLITRREIVPSGMASRITSEVDGSIHKLTTQSGKRSPRTRVEFRILNFEIVNR